MRIGARQVLRGAVALRQSGHLRAAYAACTVDAALMRAKVGWAEHVQVE
jgi:hypothetical protein